MFNRQSGTSCNNMTYFRCFVLLWVPLVTRAYKPVVVMHGMGDDAIGMRTLAINIENVRIIVLQEKLIFRQHVVAKLLGRPLYLKINHGKKKLKYFEFEFSNFTIFLILITCDIFCRLTPEQT